MASPSDMTVVAPAETEPAPRRRRWLTVAVIVGAVVVMCVLQAYRQAGIRSWNTVWAEDGATYFQQGRHLGSVLDTYAGYLQVVPRLVGWGSTLVPLDQLARYLTVVATLVTSALAVALFLLSRPLVPSAWLRAVLALSTFLVPGVLGENLTTPTNLIWVLLFACWWALIIVPATRGRTVACSVIVAASTLSSVLSLLYVPLVALLAYKRRDRGARVVLGTYALCAVLQTVFTLTADDPEAKHTTHAGTLLSVYATRVLGSGVFGDSLVKTMWLDHGYLGTFLALALVLALVVFLLVRTAGVHRCLGALAVAYSVGVYIFAIARRGTTGVELHAGQWNYNGSRFVALSLWLLLSGIVVLLSALRSSERVRNVLVAVLVVQFTVVAIANYREVNGRSHGPAWNEQVAAVTVWCNEHPQQATAIPITPPGWFVIMSCERVLR